MGEIRPAAGSELQHSRAPVWRWVAAAVLVAGLCWAAPAIDEIEGIPATSR